MPNTLTIRPTTGPRPELDLAEARERLRGAAEEAKRLEGAGRGFEGNREWERYELIRGAIEAQERSGRRASGDARTCRAHQYALWHA